MSSTNEFAGRLVEQVSVAPERLFWANISAQGRGDEVIADVWRAPPLWRVMARAPISLASGTKLSWRGRTLVVLRAEEDPQQKDRIIYICEERL